ncbi:MAG: iron-containing alcohol dehydrogenase [Pseudoflavonifractor sp.]|nr:iron-containing alcohol dehydrogenase [Pseudoflavonifractor sp.]
MENFTFWSPTKFVFGRDTESRTGELTKEAGGRKALVVYGGGSVVRSGLLDRVIGSLDRVGVSHIEMGGIKPNPTDDRVYEGIEVARRENIDFMLAVGGGSVIDTAKGIACGVPYDGDFWDFYCGKKIVEKALPVGVVLTIPAAGSEGSGNSVITRLDGLHKLSLRTESALRPRFAVMNPVLTMTLPPYQTAAGIIDMMVHIMERYFTPTQGVEITDRVAEGVLRAIIDQARVVMAHPDDYDARANIMWSGTLAHNGVCGTGRVEDWSSHFMEHELSAVYGVTHGAGLAVIVPAWLEYVTAKNPARPAQFAELVMDVKGHGDATETALEGIKRLREFFTSIGMPVTMRELGIDNPDIDLLVSKVHENKGEQFGGYVRLDATATRAIYESAR